MKMITTLTDRATLAAVAARSRLDSLTSDPELGGRMAPVDRHVLTAVVAFVGIVVCVLYFVARFTGLLG